MIVFFFSFPAVWLYGRFKLAQECNHSVIVVGKEREEGDVRLKGEEEATLVVS